MTTENPTAADQPRKTRIIHKGGGESIYGLGIIGAWVYYIGHATSFGMGVLGLLKGILWPAMLVYELLNFLKM